MPLHETLSDYRRTFQGQLFPWLEEEFGPFGERRKQFVKVLELVSRQSPPYTVPVGLEHHPSVELLSAIQLTDKDALSF